MEIRNALSRLPFFKFAIVTGKCFKKKKNEYANFVIRMKLKMRLFSFFNVEIIRTYGRV